MVRVRVLIADDNQGCVTSMLATRFDVIWGSQGQAGRHSQRHATSSDIAILDICMPVQMGSRCCDNHGMLAKYRSGFPDGIFGRRRRFIDLALSHATFVSFGVG